MNLNATIELQPSFSMPHLWTVELSSTHGTVKGECDGVRGAWKLSSVDLEAVPREVRLCLFPDKDYHNSGLDGIDVHFSITAGSVVLDKTIWCPERRLCPEYASLLRWCWCGLYEHSPLHYREHLEHLYSYFSDWGIPILRTANGLRIFGSLTLSHKAALKRCFDSVTGLPAPVIDMTNFGGTGTLLYPLFKRFFKRSPSSKWLVSYGAYQQMKEAGIPESAMVLGTSLTPNH